MTPADTETLGAGTPPTAEQPTAAPPIAEPPTAEQPLLDPPGMTTGGMTPGGMTTEGMTPRGMTMGGMTTGGMTPGGDGATARHHLSTGQPVPPPGDATGGMVGERPDGRHPRRRFSLGNSALAWPLLAFFAVCVLLPVLMLVLASLGLDTGRPTLVHFARFFTDRLSVPVLGRTLRLGLEVAALAIVLAYPLSLIFVAATQRLQALLTLLIILPLLTSAVVRTFAWVVILGRQGLINQALLAFGLIRQPVPLLYTEPALVVALAQIELPLMTLPLISALSAIDPRLAEASVALGGGRWGTFRRVTLPLSLPGAIAGLLLVFASACSALITQSIVGGGRLLFMPLYIYQQGMQAQDWPFAAAISLMLLLSVLTVVALVNLLGRLAQRHLHA